MGPVLGRLRRHGTALSRAAVQVATRGWLGGSTERRARTVRLLGLLLGGCGLAHQKGGRDRKAIVWLLVFLADSWGGLPENVGPNTLRRARAVQVSPQREEGSSAP